MALWSILGALAGGAGLGALTNKKSRGGIADFLFGSDKFKRERAFTPQQNQLFQGMGNTLQNSGGYNQAFSNLQNLLDPSNEAYDRFTAPYMRQFNEQTLPMLAERFAGFGNNSGALSSSGFGQSLGAAGAGLQENLASLKSQLGLQAGQQIFGQYGNFLQQKPEYAYQQQNQGFLAPFLGSATGAFFGGR